MKNPNSYIQSVGQFWSKVLIVLMLMIIGACTQTTEGKGQVGNAEKGAIGASDNAVENNISALPAPNSTTTKKYIALTFDDAPRGEGPVYSGNERADILITALGKANTGPVAFFVTTNGLNKPGAKERIEKYARAGHFIANHSHTHPWSNRVTVETYLNDIDKAEKHLAYLNIDDGQRRPWFRFPFLNEGTPREKRDAIREGLAARGLKNGTVTVDNYDWFLESQWRKALREGRTVDRQAMKKAYIDILMGAIQFYDDLAITHLGRSPAHVLLLHENDVAALFIDDLVAALRAEGWEIISPDQAYSDPLQNITPTTLKTRQGHLAALAIEAGADPRSLTHLAIEENQIVDFLETRNVFGKKPNGTTNP